MRARIMTDEQLKEFLDAAKLRADEVLLSRNSTNNQASVVFDKSMTDDEVMEILNSFNREE